MARLDVVVLAAPPVLQPTIFGALGSGVSEAGDANAAVGSRSTGRGGR